MFSFYSIEERNEELPTQCITWHLSQGSAPVLVFMQISIFLSFSEKLVTISSKASCKIVTTRIINNASSTSLANSTDSTHPGDSVQTFRYGITQSPRSLTTAIERFHHGLFYYPSLTRHLFLHLPTAGVDIGTLPRSSGRVKFRFFLQKVGTSLSFSFCFYIKSIHKRISRRSLTLSFRGLVFLVLGLISS